LQYVRAADLIAGSFLGRRLDPTDCVVSYRVASSNQAEVRERAPWRPAASRASIRPLNPTGRGVALERPSLPTLERSHPTQLRYARTTVRSPRTLNHCLTL
jgi:hypothetical protein